jgi:hypothetical protein
MPKTSEDLLFPEGQGGDTDTTHSQEQAESLRATNTIINYHKINNNILTARTFSLYQYFVHKLEFLYRIVLHSYNVIMPVSPPNIFPIWFRTRIIGNKTRNFC